MWSEIFIENGDFLAHEIDGIVSSLNKFAEVIRNGDRETLREMLKQAREIKTIYRSSGLGVNNMNTITVTSSVNYDIIIGRGLLNNIGELILKNLSPNHTAIITDDIVDRLYGSSLDSSLQKSGISACKFDFSPRRGF